MESSMVVSQKNLKKNYRMIQQFHFWVCTKKNWKQGLRERLVQLCSQQHYLQQPKGGSNPNVHLPMNKQNVAYKHKEKLFSPERRGNPNICYNMDETWRPYAKWNESVTQRQILYSSTLYKVPRIVKFRETEIRRGSCQGLWRRRERGAVFNRYGVSVSQDGRVLDLGYKTVWMCMTLLNCTSG